VRALWVTNMWPDEQRPWSGSFAYSQAQSLQRLGVAVDVIHIRGYRGRQEYGRAIRALQRAMATARYDVVHAHYGHSGVIARLQARTPLVISYCGDDLLGTPAADRAGFTRTSLMTAKIFAQLARVARATVTKSQAMEERLPRSCRNRNHVIPNGVDLSAFAPMDAALARLKLGWSNELPNVLFVGDPKIPRKNVRLAEQVCEELARRGKPVELRICWNVAPALMPTWLNAADAFLCTSLSEGSPNAVKEAMAVELPIVSAAVGDVAERLAGVDGTFIARHDATMMADALEDALRVGRTPSARRAVEQISLERVAERLLVVYRVATS
jgi:glycosyltransferase involved in cell wall biosynthesis